MSAVDANSTLDGFAASPINTDSTVQGFRAIEAGGIANDEVSQDELSSSSPQVNAGDPVLGTTVDQFRIKSVLASGGMGTVYLAWQQHPVQRNVALKTIRRGMSDQATLNRFLIERQTLALMDHPDIARVYDAGTTPEGTPYFAMEYCEGLPIDQYCDERQLGITDRIQLVIRIARAVQRAHAAGIVHRDLKPGNILVADCEGRPNLKIIDFGIAKFT
ncbi:MAG: serine/threonine-protein kinase, partial [Planctomycetota bacterium]